MMRGSTMISHSGRSLHLTTAFESSLNFDGNTSDANSSSSCIGYNASSNTDNNNNNNNTSNNAGTNQINVLFGLSTNVADLKYFAERGCIVHLLRALDTP